MKILDEQLRFLQVNFLKYVDSENTLSYNELIQLLQDLKSSKPEETASIIYECVEMPTTSRLSFGVFTKAVRMLEDEAGSGLGEQFAEIKNNAQAAPAPGLARSNSRNSVNLTSSEGLSTGLTRSGSRSSIQLPTNFAVPTLAKAPSFSRSTSVSSFGGPTLTRTPSLKNSLNLTSPRTEASGSTTSSSTGGNSETPTAAAATSTSTATATTSPAPLASPRASATLSSPRSVTLSSPRVYNPTSATTPTSSTLPSPRGSAGSGAWQSGVAPAAKPAAAVAAQPEVKSVQPAWEAKTPSNASSSNQADSSAAGGKLTKFTWHGSADRDALLVGDWTNWAEKPITMNRSGNEFVAEARVSPGRHEFRFIIDGVWRHDEQQQRCPNGVGSENNYINV